MRKPAAKIFVQLFTTVILMISATKLNGQQEQSIVISYFLDYEIFSEYATSYLSTLEEKLSHHKIIIYQNNETAADEQDVTQIEIWFDTNFDGERIADSLSIEFKTNKNVLSQISSLLHDTTRENHGTIITAPVDEAAQLSAAIVLFGFNRCDEAIPYLKDLQTSADLNEQANLYLGNCALLQENYAAAIENFEAILYDAGGSPFTTTATKIAWSYMQLGQQTEAFETINLAVSDEWSSDAGKANALSNRAQLYILISDYDSAITDMDAAITLDAKNPALYSLRGQIYLNLYEWDKSLDDFNRAIELAPEYADAYFQRGVLYYSILQTGQELREEALADFRHYLELAPDGEHAEQAREYAAKIEAELATLNE
jgi:tetratricopeptide (TPR) repeat protein